MFFLIALWLLTILPVPYPKGYPAKRLGRSIASFPVVGALLGLALWGLDWLLRAFLPLMLVNVLLLAFLAIVTGCLHLDGFADTCDGLAARGSPSERLKALKDSRVGAFGVVGVCFMIFAQIASLVALPMTIRIEALILMTVISRWAMACSIWVFPSARGEGMGWGIKQGATWKETVIAAAIALGIAWALLSWSGLTLLAGLTVLALVFGRYLSGRFGGLSGDNYGAVNEVTQLGVLILIYIMSDFYLL